MSTFEYTEEFMAGELLDAGFTRTGNDGWLLPNNGEHTGSTVSAYRVLCRSRSRAAGERMMADYDDEPGRPTPSGEGGKPT